jgi:hypothetical protein
LQGLILTSVFKKLNAPPFTSNQAIRLIKEHKLKLVVARRAVPWLNGDIGDK